MIIREYHKQGRWREEKEKKIKGGRVGRDIYIYINGLHPRKYLVVQINLGHHPIIRVA